MEKPDHWKLTFCSGRLFGMANEESAPRTKKLLDEVAQYLLDIVKEDE